MRSHKRFRLSCIVVLVVFSQASDARSGEPVRFDDYFADGALRVDVVHSGNAAEEEFAVRRIVIQPVWAGPEVNLVAQWDMGRCRLDLRDEASGRVIFRRGFSSLFGEWRTTEEAVVRRRAFEETLEMPLPKNVVELRLLVRDERGTMREVFTTSVDPNSRLIERPGSTGGIKVHEIMVNGEPDNKVDVLILGDGYTIVEREKFLQDCRHIIDELFDVEPFKAYRRRFNVRAIQVPAAESGIDEPRKGIFTQTPFGMSFNTFDSPRYCMSEDVWAIRDVAASAPHDAILLMANSSRYGGGAIFNFYTAFVSDNEYDDYLCVHEFGHGFAGLADEYYSSEVSYNEFYPGGVEPWEPNITALLDPDELKWKRFVEPGTPIPTPDDDPRYADEVGAFEGAGYAAKGLYRPAVDCKMFSKGKRRFCRVCERAVIDMIVFYAPD